MVSSFVTQKIYHAPFFLLTESFRDKFERLNFCDCMAVLYFDQWQMARDFTRVAQIEGWEMLLKLS